MALAVIRIPSPWAIRAGRRSVSHRLVQVEAPFAAFAPLNGFVRWLGPTNGITEVEGQASRPVPPSVPPRRFGRVGAEGGRPILRNVTAALTTTG